MAFVCGSWLLYEGHREFLPGNSNILRFMDDFDIIRSADKEKFGDGWRVFGKYSNGPVDDLPEDTSIRRAFKQRLQQGKPTGYGYGVFFFDGERYSANNEKFKKIVDNRLVFDIIAVVARECDT